MKCALCGNEESLLIQVQAGSGLSLLLCPEHEHLPLFEVAAMLAAENEKLIAEIARLRKTLELIKENSLECFNCSSSLLAEDALDV